MHRKAAIAAGLLSLLAANAYAGKPPLFKPWMSDSWTWQQKQLANKALDVLFDTCPAIGRYLQHDIQDAQIYTEDMNKPLDAQFAPRFWKQHGWNKVLRLDLTTVPNPRDPVLAPDAGKIGIDVQFFMGAGDDPGIYFESDQRGLCGATHSISVTVQGDASVHIPDSHDTFVPVPQLKLLERL